MSHLYLAAPWIDKDLMDERAAQFEKAGHVITWKWWETDAIPEGDDHVESLQTQAVNDLSGVLEADFLVLFNTSKSEGKAVEQGIALVDHIPIIAIGKRGTVSKNVFHYLEPQYTWVDDIPKALESIHEWTEVPEWF